MEEEKKAVVVAGNDEKEAVESPEAKEEKKEVVKEEEAKEEEAAAAEEESPTEAKGGDSPTVKKNRIQVSTNKKPLYFYVNLAKRYMQNYNEVELSALGMAIGTVVTVAEILKNNGLATEKKILTSTIGTKDESKGRLVRKARIEILLGKSENFNNQITNRKADRIKAVEEEIKV